MLLLGGLLIVGLIGGAAWFMFNELNLSLHPGTAEDLAHSMMDYELPSGERGLVSSPDLMGAEVAVVQSLGTDATTTLMLGKVPPAAQDEWGTQLEDFLDIFNDEEIFAVNEIEIQSTVTEARSLCDETATVRLSEGTEEFTNDPATVYEAIVLKDGVIYLVSLSTTGTDHAANAEQVFGTLDCK